MRLLPAISPRLRAPLAAGAIYLALSALLRIALALRFGGGLGRGAGEWALTFLCGLHADLAVALCGAAVLAVPFAILRRRRPAQSRGGMALRSGALGVAMMLMVFLLISEWYFFDEFASRFNTVAIDYLIYPHEVTTNLWESFPLPAIIAAVALGGIALAWLCLKVGSERGASGDPPPRRWLSFAGLAALAAAAAVSLRPAERSFSPERVVNEIAQNGIASALHAAWTRNLSYAAFYATLDRDDAWARARRVLGAHPGESLTGDPAPPSPPPDADGEIDPDAYAAWLAAARASVERQVSGDPSRPRLNVCLIMEESLGSEFWGALGRVKRKSGKPETLTPEMDRIAGEEGLLFTNLYADGNRTIRGFEGVCSSFPPLPGDSILARDRTEGVETLARVLSRDGYQGCFIYGGHGTFDHLAGYAEPNGWARFIDQDDIENPVHTTAWGHCDEDVLHRAIEEMRSMHAGGQPFFLTCMTVSNHRPFTFPAGRIQEDPEAKSRKHAVKYSDWALGDFFRRAKAEPFWRDTIFAVVADHGARVYGSEEIPIKSYEIPLVIAGPAAAPQPRRIDTLGCQLDVAPTLLGLIGRPYRTLFFGRDLLRAGDPSLCLMHHNRSIAAYGSGRMAVFGLNKTITYYRGDPKRGDLVPMAEPDAAARELAADGEALFRVADELYMGRQYLLPEPTDNQSLAAHSR